MGVTLLLLFLLFWTQTKYMQAFVTKVEYNSICANTSLFKDAPCIQNYIPKPE